MSGQQRIYPPEKKTNRHTQSIHENAISKKKWLKIEELKRKEKLRRPYGVVSKVNDLEMRHVREPTKQKLKLWNTRMIRLRFEIQIELAVPLKLIYRAIAPAELLMRMGC